MKETGLMFKAASIRAILAGTKRQTRRLVKAAPGDGGFVVMEREDGSRWPFRSDDGESCFVTETTKEGDVKHEIALACPYGGLGDRLWGKEAHVLEHCIEPGQLPPHDDGRPLLTRPDGDDDSPAWIQPHYRATDAVPALAYADLDEPGCRWRSPLFMPRWASRLTLDLAAVRVERLQDITEADAIAEGVQPLPLQAGESGAWWTADPTVGPQLHARTPVDAYRRFWNRINGPDSWEDNPFVWVLGFEPAPASTSTASPVKHRPYHPGRGAHAGARA